MSNGKNGWNRKSSGKIKSFTKSIFFARVRIITIEGVIERIDGIEKAAERLNHLQNLFSLQTNLATLEEKELFIKDIFGNDWKIFIKIKEPFEFFEGNDEIVGSHYNFRVVLESTKSPVYKSFEENFIESKSGDFGGFTLDFELEKAFDEQDGLLQINTLGNISIPLRFEIIATGRVIFPLIIRNVKNNDFFKLENMSDLQAGDKIIIDTENFSVLKNGENIIDKRSSGSVWLKSRGSSSFLVTDSSSGFDKNFISRVYFSNSML
ncbi:hypothetical protein DLH72_02225 [Candidatus Gracilibacteria bacterium]|nr:MAG: hypothetical protein DLH72_02225 [Candidatus Gracilibacteria bacterium]